MARTSSAQFGPLFPTRAEMILNILLFLSCMNHEAQLSQVLNRVPDNINLAPFVHDAIGSVSELS